MPSSIRLNARTGLVRLVETRALREGFGVPILHLSGCRAIGRIDDSWCFLRGIGGFSRSIYRSSLYLCSQSKQWSQREGWPGCVSVEQKPVSRPTVRYFPDAARETTQAAETAQIQGDGQGASVGVISVYFLLAPRPVGKEEVLDRFYC